MADFSGSGDDLRLRIQENPASGYNDNAFIVENFSVTPVPEPASILSSACRAARWSLAAHFAGAGINPYYECGRPAHHGHTYLTPPQQTPMTSTLRYTAGGMPAAALVHALALSVLLLNGLAQAATPALGIMGDSIGAGDGSGLGENPNWVAQLTNSGTFVVPGGGNQAAWGATASNNNNPNDFAAVAAQLPGIQAIVSDLNYVTLIIGGNDFADLLTGNETVATFNSTVVSQIETVLNALPPSVHEIVATIPDIAATPAIQAEFSPAAIAAAEPVVQAANAQIATFAESHTIPVLDLYGFTHNVIRAPLRWEPHSRWLV